MRYVNARCSFPGIHRFRQTKRPRLKSHRLVFIFSALLAWIPIVLLLFIFINGLVHLKIPLPGTAKSKGVSWDGCSSFGILYAVISFPITLLLAWVRPRSRLLSYVFVLPFSVVIPLIVIIVLLPTVYWGIYAVIFMVTTWNLGPVIWAVAVAELRWRLAESERHGLSLFK